MTRAAKKRKLLAVANSSGGRQRQWVTTRHLAELWGVEEGTLTNARSTGRGVFRDLPYYKLGHLVRYDLAEALSWFENKRIERSHW
jgi:hypothetical protein